MNEVNTKSAEVKARRTAKRNGFLARKSRTQRSSDNLGGFILIDSISGAVIAGVKFELSADDVINFCNQ